MMRHAPQPVAEVLSGHAPQSTPEARVRSERTHVALAPLAHVGVPYATGDVAGLAVLLPAGLSQSERTLCWDVFSTIEKLSMQWGEWDLSITDAEERAYALQSRRWTGTGTIWSTVTPFVFDRFPEDPYGNEAQQTVREAFFRAGLPEPVEIDLHYNPWHTGSFKASAFPPAAAREGKPRRYHCHVWARFEQRLRGPVVTGAGRYYGYGLFLPLNPAGRQ
jgi:CRISPR-associated protein Csb2